MRAAKAALRESVDPFKWICVGVSPDKVRVESNGDLICIVMDEENGDYYADNFLSLACGGVSRKKHKRRPAAIWLRAFCDHCGFTGRFGYFP